MSGFVGCRVWVKRAVGGGGYRWMGVREGFGRAVAVGGYMWVGPGVREG